MSRKQKEGKDKGDKKRGLSLFFLIGISYSSQGEKLSAIFSGMFAGN